MIKPRNVIAKMMLESVKEKTQERRPARSTEKQSLLKLISEEKECGCAGSCLCERNESEF